MIWQSRIATFSHPAYSLITTSGPEMGHIPQVSILGGDQLSLTIAAASVLAKTWRDTYMEDVAVEFPQYGFESHKGYGTEKHREALKKYGVTSVHRTNYAPIIKIMNGEF
ncbi:MAG: hypothetical protein Q9P01_19855 [Anaerolineae bacterium]|nr:hypothetical protein [Anaerolineae bacterium]